MFPAQGRVNGAGGVQLHWHCYADVIVGQAGNELACAACLENDIGIKDQHRIGIIRGCESSVDAGGVSDIGPDPQDHGPGIGSGNQVGGAIDGAVVHHPESPTRLPIAEGSDESSCGIWRTELNVTQITATSSWSPCLPCSPMSRLCLLGLARVHGLGGLRQMTDL